MGNAGEHGESVPLRKAKPLCHLGEVVGERVMTPLNALRPTLAAARIAQGRDGIGTDNDAGILLPAGRLSCQAVLAVEMTATRLTTVGKMQGWNDRLEV